MRLGALIAAVLFAVAVPGQAAAVDRATLEVCNRDPRPFRIAVISREFLFLQHRWESVGWFEVPAGRCQRWNRTGGALFILSVTADEEEGRRILDYGVDDIPSRFWRSASYATEEFFCVSDDPFERRATSDTALKTCRSDEYLQLFNQLIWVSANTTYTLTLE